MPVVSAPRFRLWPPNSGRPKQTAAARVCTMRAIERGVSRAVPSWGRGGGADRGAGGIEIRRNTAPSEIPAVANQAVSVRTGQSSVRPQGAGGQ